MPIICTHNAEKRPIKLVVRTCWNISLILMTCFLMELVAGQLNFTPTPPLRDRWWCCLCWHVLAVSISVFKCSIGSHINNLLYIYIYIRYTVFKKKCFIICICVFIHKMYHLFRQGIRDRSQVPAVRPNSPQAQAQDFYLYSYFTENPGNQCFLHSSKSLGQFQSSETKL